MHLLKQVPVFRAGLSSRTLLPVAVVNGLASGPRNHPDRPLSFGGEQTNMLPLAGVSPWVCRSAPSRRTPPFARAHSYECLGAAWRSGRSKPSPGGGIAGVCEPKDLGYALWTRSASANLMTHRWSGSGTCRVGRSRQRTVQRRVSIIPQRTQLIPSTPRCPTTRRRSLIAGPVGSATASFPAVDPPQVEPFPAPNPYVMSEAVFVERRRASDRPLQNPANAETKGGKTWVVRVAL